MSAAYPRRARHTAQLALAITTTALTTLLTACSVGSTPGSGITSASLPGKTTTSTTPTTANTGPVPPTPLTYTPGDPAGIGAWIQVAAPTNLTPGQKAALTAWATYWQITMQAYNTYGENIATNKLVRSLDAVATVQARDATVQGVRTRARSHALTVGPVKFNIRELKVDAGSATIQACVDDQSYEVNEQGKALSHPHGRRSLSNSMARHGTQWQVSSAPQVGGAC